MKDLKDITCCVVDHGRFVHVARTLGEQYGKVYYVSPDERDCPVIREACVGDGFPEIERIRSLWSVKEKCDLFVFPDIGFVAEQDELRKQGFPVWGSGYASNLESNKGLFLSALSETQLPIPPHIVIEGLDNLRVYLMDNEDQFIKVSRFRGDWETMHWTNYESMEGTLDNYAVRFGPLKNHLKFYVFDNIETEIEDGVDAYFVDGKWPKTILHGMENKDKSFIGTMQKFDELPDEVKVVNEEIAPILQRMNGGTGMKFSTEVRITKEGESYFIDPTARFGSPPSQGECCLYLNLGEIIWNGARGILTEPEYDDDVVVQASVTLENDRTDWNSIKVDEPVARHLKCGNCCEVDGKLVFPPMTEYHTFEAGYLCATGKGILQAIERLRDLKDELPDGMKCDFESLSKLLVEIKQAEESGMEFTDGEVPEPTVVIDG